MNRREEDGGMIRVRRNPLGGVWNYFPVFTGDNDKFPTYFGLSAGEIDAASSKGVRLTRRGGSFVPFDSSGQAKRAAGEANSKVTQLCYASFSADLEKARLTKQDPVRLKE